MATVLLQNQTPPSGKHKKKSKSERKRRRREREQAEVLAAKEKEKNNFKRKEELTPSVEKTPETDSAHKVVKVANDSMDVDDDDEAKDDTKLKLVNETSITSRKIAFVYPKKDRTSVDGKPVSYVHSKFRKSTTTNKHEEGHTDNDANEEEKKKVKELMDDSIDDILFPEKKKRKSESEGKKQDKKLGNKAGSDENGNEKSKHKKSKEEEAASKKNKIKEKKRDEDTKSPKAPRSVEKRLDHDEEKKETDVTSPNENDSPPVRGRRRSDSLSDPMKVRLSGRTVEDAVKDASGRRPRSNSTDSELNLPKRGLCDERVVIRNYKWDLTTFKRTPPRGLINLGNTCFLNSTLQCLTYLPTFCQSVATLPTNSGSGYGKKKSNNGLQMTMFVRSLLRRVHGLDGEAKQSALAPKQIVKALSLLGGGTHQGYKFRPGRQEDAHEFLVHLLDAMNDGELKAAGMLI